MVFENLSTQLGLSVWLLAVIFIWTAAWKLAALWKAARKGHIAWFIVVALINTVGILPILYIYVFSKFNCKNCSLKPEKKPTKKVVKKKAAKKKK